MQFVLVHGSWHDGSAWDAVVTHLQGKGHRALAPTLAGHGKGADKNVSHDQCVGSIADFIVGEDLSDVVLVGHSFGGTIISRVAQLIPQRLRRLVFWNAIVPHDGESMLDSMPPEFGALFAQMAAASEDNTVMLPFALWRDGMINDADLKTATSCYGQLSPEPFQPFTEKLDMKKFYELIRSGKLPCSFVNCTEDGLMSWHPHMTGRLGLFRLVQMPGSHEVIFTNPAGLAEKIVEAGRD